MSDPSDSSLESLFQAALERYEEQTGEKLINHPLAQQFEQCNSVESITAVFQEQAQAFNKFQFVESKVMKPLKCIVHILHTLSTTLSANKPLFKAISLSVSFSPAAAISIAFAILLRAIEDVSASYDALVDLLESMERFLSRLDIYIRLPLVTPTLVMAETIVKIMVELLSATALVTKQIKQKLPLKLIKKLLGEKDVEDVLHRLDRLTLDEGRDTAAQTLEVVYGLVANMRLILDGGKATADGIRKALEIMQDIATQINKSKREERLQYAREWIRPPDPWENHDAARESHHRGTSTWFVRGNAYTKWKSSRDSSGSNLGLWIHSKPGVGKTILCSTIIEDISHMRRRGLASLAFFYCDFRFDDKKCLRGLLSSLLVQFCHLSDSYSTILSNFYSEYDNGSRRPSDEALIGCLKRILKHPGQAPTYIIIDGLDECPNTIGMPSPREKVLKFVKDLVDLHLENLHICITSRPEVDIKIFLDALPFNQTSLDTESGQVQDITDYIKCVVNTDERMKRWKEADKKLVVEVLTRKSDTMFRWVFCQFEFIRHCLPAWIRDALGELPESLDETYERILQDIHNTNRKFARRLFQCLAAASRPLRVEELAEFLTFNFDVDPTPAFRANLQPEDLIDAVLFTCSSLLAVVKRGSLTFIQFSHFSVKEYLTTARLAEAKGSISHYHISMASAHALMVQACLGTLLHLDEREITRDSLKNFPIVEYAAKYWVEHARFGDVSANTLDAMKRLVDPRRPHFSVWLWICNPTVSWQIRSERPTQPQGSCLYYATYLGFHDLIMFLVSECSPDMNARGFDDMTALHLASRDGHVGIARVLLERGADVRILDKKEWTPLRYALDKGHIEVGRVLLEYGAETRAQGMDGWIPLCWASRHGHVEVAGLLLEHGADANTRDRNKTLLHLALEGGHVEVARLLLDYGAVAGAQDSSVVRLVSQGGHVGVVLALLELNAGVDVVDQDKKTPLRYALEERHVEVSRFGANINAQGKNEWIPLHWASHLGFVDIAQLLLKYGADAHFQDRDGWSPLHLASKYGHVAVARLLLQRGIDASAQNKSKSTPLHLASEHGHVELARLLLLQHGVDPTAQDVNKRTPLHLASEGGHVELAQLLLLQHGVDPTAQDVNKRTPLHLASKNGYAELARVLLQPEHGVDVDARDMNMWTPLHWASPGGHVEVARVLLQRRADAKAEDADKWTALHLASGDAEVEAARLVLGRGVDVGSQGMVELLQLYQHWRTQGHVGIPLEHSEDAIVHDLSKWARLRLYRPNTGNVELARVLLENGADASAQDKNNSTPLHWASGCGLVELAQVLLENGANASARDKDKSTPLHRVSESGQVGVVRILLQGETYRPKKFPPIGLSQSNMCGELAELLLTRNADVSAQDKDKFSPLHLASGGAGYFGSHVPLQQYGISDAALRSLRLSESLRLVRALLTHGADVRTRDKDNSTPLHWASGGGYVELARTLLKRRRAALFDRESGPNPDIEDIHILVAQVLLEHGADADVNVQDTFGSTPLQRALRARFFRIEGLLLSHNAHPQVEDDYMEIDNEEHQQNSKNS